MTDVKKIRPKGPWVLVKVDKPSEKSGVLYLPQGNREERVGHATATVLRVGDGHPNNKKGIMRTGKKYTPSEIKEGDRVLFRGFLQEANRPHQFDREHCLLHLRDIMGIVPKKAKIESGSLL